MSDKLQADKQNNYSRTKRYIYNPFFDFLRGAKEFLRKLRDPVTTFTGLLVFVSALQFWALHNTDEKIGKQLAIMGDQLEQIKGNNAFTERSVKAFENYAKTAKEHLDFAREESDKTASINQRQLRAYVSINSAEIENFDAERQVGSPLVVMIKIKNAGAAGATGQIRTAVRIFPLEINNFPNVESKPANISIPPKEEFPRAARSANVTANQLDAVMKGKSAIYAYGDFRFTDETSTKWKCNFRLYYSGVGSWPNQASTLKLVTTGGYNGCAEDSVASTSKRPS